MVFDMRAFRTSFFSPILPRMMVSPSGSAGFATKARAVTFDKYCEPGEGAIVRTHELPGVGPNQVLVKALASTINPSDINQVQGVYPSRPVFTKDLTGSELFVGGNEGIFEVVDAGENAKEFEKGSWAFPAVLSLGTWRSHLIVEKEKLFPLPKALKEKATPFQIVTSNINPVSAYMMIKNYATLEKGDWIIQNGGNSAVGRAVIQLAKLWGYKTISVVRSRDDVEELIADLKKLGADVVITEEQNLSKEFSKEELPKLVGPDAKIKLALNCVSGKSGTYITNKLCDGGHHVTYGAMSKQPLQIGAAPLIFKDITFHGFWLTASVKKDPTARNKVLSDVLGLVGEGKLLSPSVEKHLLPADKTDEENTEIARNAFNTYWKGFSNKKHVFVWE